MSEQTRARSASRWAPLLLAGTMVLAGAQIASAGFNEAGENSFFTPGPGNMVGPPTTTEQAPAAPYQTAQPSPDAAMPVRHTRVHRPAMARARTHSHSMQASNGHMVAKHRVMHASHTMAMPNHS